MKEEEALRPPRGTSARQPRHGTHDGEVRAGLDAGAALDDLLAVGAVRMDDWRRSERDRWIYPGATH